MGRTVGYARVSTNEQAFECNALDQQINRLKQANVDDVYVDVETGNSKTRKKFNRLIEEVTTGEITAIVATRWDRLTRNEVIYLEVKQLLREHQVKLHLLDQGEVDLSTAAGELQADMSAMFAVHERRMLRERIQRGNEFRRMRQVAWTRPPWGYRIQDDKYVLNDTSCICLLEDRPEDYLLLYSEPDGSKELAGISRKQIAREAIEYFLEVRRASKVLAYLYEKYAAPRRSSRDPLLEELRFWNQSNNLLTWLKNPVLRGHTAYLKCKGRKKKSLDEWEWYYNTHPDHRLISDEEFSEIQDILALNSKKVGTPGSTFYLTGLVYCGDCGHKCILKRSPQYAYYGCRYSTSGCTNHHCVRVENINEAIIRHIVSTANAIQHTPNPQPRIITETPQLIALREQLEGIEKLLAIAPNPDLQKAKYALTKQIEEQSNPELSILANATAQMLIEHPLAVNSAFWHTLAQEEREIFYAKLVDRVLLQKGEVITVELKI